MIFSPKAQENRNLEFGLIAPDKSLSHRSVIFAFLTQGRSEVRGFLRSQDTEATLKIARALGAEIEIWDGGLRISPPKEIPDSARLDCQNSGTSMRLYAGLLAAREGEFFFDGDLSLRKRPMGRIKTPLEAMGASFSSEHAPFCLRGSSDLVGFDYHSPIASAQVKGAFILSTLRARGESRYSEGELSRDHSERFLAYLGADILLEGTSLKIHPLTDLLPSYHISIPNDPSSLIFFVIACLISKNMELKITSVLLNPTRIHALEVLKQMGAKITYRSNPSGFEEVGELEVASSDLRGVRLDSHIAWLIDELPALSIAFACAKGRSEVRGASELRVKESDRIAAIVQNLRSLGIEAQEREDGFDVLGGELRDARIKSFGDHRIAMSFALAGVRCRVELDGMECVGVSFPKFLDFFSLFAAIEE